MVIKITQAKGSRGMVEYNDKKVKAGKGSVLGYNKIATDGQDIEQIAAKSLSEQLEGRTALNGGKGKKFIHISINPNPDEKLTDEKMVALTKDYMKQLGYASQPYIIYKHNDIDREHVHVVACSIKENGSLINDSNLFRRSNKIRIGLEDKYQLLKGKSHLVNSADDIPKGMDYQKSFSAGQIKSIGLNALDSLKFSDYTVYATYLKTLDVAVRQSKTKEGKILGLTYQPLEGGKLQGVPIKASRLEPGGQLGMDALEQGFKKNNPLIEGGLKAFQERLVVATGSEKSDSKLRGGSLKKAGIKPVFDGEEIFGFADLKTGYFHSLDSISPELKVGVGDLKPEAESDIVVARGNRSSSPSSSSARADLGSEDQKGEESGGVGDLFGSIGSALGQMGGDSSSPDNDQALQKKKKKKRGI